MNALATIASISNRAAVPSLADIQVMLITPDIARELLVMNVANRPLNITRVNELAKLMRDGQWIYNGDTIRISSENVLLDGQTRLNAIIKAGIPQWYIVVSNLSPVAFDTIDRGRKKTVSDSLAMRKEKNSSQLASAVRWLHVLDTNKGQGYNSKVNAIESVEALERHPEIRHWVAFFISSSSIRRLFESNVCAVAAIASKKFGHDIVMQFMRQLADGEGLKRTDPAFELRARAIQNKTKTTKTPTYTMVALTIKAMKAHCTHKQVGTLRYAPGDDWPTL
jgi:hypothetical protein